MGVDAVEMFQRAVLASGPLQERLGAIEMPDAFEAETAAAAAEIGIVLPALALVGRRATALDRWPDLGWLPARSLPDGAALAFEWAWFGAGRLTDPFYGDSVRRMGVRPFSRAFRPRTSLDVLIAGAAGEEALAPQGFVFHMSRCGSTLAAQMLAAVPHHIVVSEAAPIDAIVQWASESSAPLEDRLAALRAIVAALGRDRSGAARRYFVKLDSWHVLALPLFRAAFPDVPWIFLYRDPAEVMVSQMRMPGLHLASPRVAVEPNRAFSLEAHGSQVLARFLTAAGESLALGGGMLVNYAGLAQAMQADVPRHFGFLPDAEESAAMAGAQARDAKAPGEPFVADAAAKRAAVTPAIAAAVEAFLRKPYARLEDLRDQARHAQ
ncbi:sulfotransferase [Sphingomonas sp. MS122]|uniref:sulfotransferase n=1 Tax=Sphingomonas sp. MS122 TaxID=3412683 RepID=UPI003C2FCB10